MPMREKTIRQLWGQDFDIVREGLDEAQVEAFVSQLVAERSALLQRQEHLLSLMKLAERTVTEADRLSADIKREAESEARAKATEIIARAEQEAKEYMEQKRTEVLTSAGREADAMKASAREAAESLANQYRQRAQDEFQASIQRLHSQLLSGLKGVMESAAALKPEWEHRLAELMTTCARPEDQAAAPPPPATPHPKAEKAPIEPGPGAKSDVLAKLEQAWTEGDLAASPAKPPTPPPTMAHSPETETGKLTAVVLDKEAAPAQHRQSSTKK